MFWDSGIPTKVKKCKKSKEKQFFIQILDLICVVCSVFIVKM
jgi:hypothetical protein